MENISSVPVAMKGAEKVGENLSVSCSPSSQNQSLSQDVQYNEQSSLLGAEQPHVFCENFEDSITAEDSVPLAQDIRPSPLEGKFCDILNKNIENKTLVPSFNYKNENSKYCNLLNNNNMKTILHEDKYTEELEKIIQRDFFPDLSKLRAQNEYLEALEKNDIVKLRELVAKYCPRTGVSRPGTALSASFNSPNTFETPRETPSKEGWQSFSEKTDHIDTESANNPVKSEKEKHQSLDQFLSKYTSEDNASFEVIMEEASRRHQQRFPWLYQDETRENYKMESALALPSIQQQAIENGRPSTLTTWEYKNRNSLMYIPDGAELTAEERLQQEKQQEVVYTNTHFKQAPFNERTNQAAIAEAASLQAKTKEGKVGIDGKELQPLDSPKVNGYSFVVTPSPAPGVTESPLMTWGEIEGTPFRLDGSDTPLPQSSGGPQFKIPDLPSREKLAISLADQAAKNQRAKKEQALKRVQSSLLHPSRCGTGTPKTPTDRLSSMSPAAQLLARSKLGIHRGSDHALRASYTPSPSHTPSQDKTPLLIQTLTKSPSKRISRKQRPDSTPSLTDNLLQIPKRQKAADYF
ncbi:ess-2 splicing factor homolog [Tachypleus tridentatus]|uniref:ess-2 splicing factor homolog n=1 Tax=Tachypleus tridentatus TaxID=6853 RepID=UPI003FD0B5E5